MIIIDFSSLLSVGEADVFDHSSDGGWPYLIKREIVDSGPLEDDMPLFIFEMIMVDRTMIGGSVCYGDDR